MLDNLMRTYTRFPHKHPGSSQCESGAGMYNGEVKPNYLFQVLLHGAISLHSALQWIQIIKEHRPSHQIGILLIISHEIWVKQHFGATSDPSHA